MLQVNFFSRLATSLNVPYALVVIMLAAGLIRIGLLAVVLLYGAGEPILGYGDAGGYLELASNLAQGKSYVSKNDITGSLQPEVFRSPGLPLLLVPFANLSYGLIVWAVLLSIVTGILLPYLTFRISSYVFNASGALVAAALVAFEPHLVWFSWLPLTELPFILFSLGGFWFALRAWETKKNSLALWSGLLLGYSALIRPPYIPVYLVGVFTVAAWHILKKRSPKLLLGIVFGMIIVLVPWAGRNWAHTGTFSVSGLGWSNVYLDYLASVRAVDNNTPYYVEKKNLEMNPPIGVLPENVQSPSAAGVLREAVFVELWVRRGTTLKVGVFSLLSFYTNDSYYYYMRRFGLLQETQRPEGIASVSYALLTRGLDGFSHAFAEMKRQYFIPFIGRLFSFGILGLALLGVWFERRRPMTWLIAGIIILVSVFTMAVGLGVEVRYRVPVEPFMFMLASSAIYKLIRVVRNRYAGKYKTNTAHLHSGV